MGNQGNWGGPPQGGGPGVPGGMGPQGGGFGAPQAGQAPGAYGAPAGPGVPGGYGAPPTVAGAPPGYGGPPAPGMGGFPQPASPYGQYEFTAAENGTVEDCSKWGTALAIVYFVVGGFSVFTLCSSPLQAIINIVTYIAVGVFIMMATKSLKLVVTTQGNDVAHMMEALDKLGTMFLIRLIAATVSILLTMLVLVIQTVRLAANF